MLTAITQPKGKFSIYTYTAFNISFKWRQVMLLTHSKRSTNFLLVSFLYGARGTVVVKALCYKPEGRGVDTLCCDFLNLPSLSGHTRP
jgi:hypothetical protein